MAKDYTREQLYAEICRGNFSELTLHCIEKTIRDIENGTGDLKRYGKDLCAGMLAGGSKLAAAALICRADETAGARSEKGGGAAQSQTSARQQQLLERWAKATGCWIDTGIFDEKDFVAEGFESTVYRKDDGTVTKLNKLSFCASPQSLVDRLCIHNTLFPATGMTVRGFGKQNDRFCIIYDQPFVEGRAATPQEIESMVERMTNSRAEHYGNGHSDFRTDLILLSDLYPENVLIDRHSGLAMVIDSCMKLNTPELKLNGKYIIPPPQADYENNIKNNIAMRQLTDNETTNTPFVGPSNEVTIEGIIDAVTRTADGKGYELTVMTAATDPETGKHVNRLYHSVKIEGRSEKAEAKLHNLDTNKEQTIYLKGRYTNDADNTPYILADASSLRFPRKTGMINRFDFEGKVAGITHNSAYALAILESKTHDGRMLLLPLCIYRDDNPKQYNDLSSGNVEKGTVLKLRGPLIPQMYTDGEKTMLRYSVNTARFTVLEQKQEKTEKTANKKAAQRAI